MDDLPSRLDSLDLGGRTPRGRPPANNPRPQIRDLWRWKRAENEAVQLSTGSDRAATISAGARGSTTTQRQTTSSDIFRSSSRGRGRGSNRPRSASAHHSGFPSNKLELHTGLGDPQSSRSQSRGGSNVRDSHVGNPRGRDRDRGSGGHRGSHSQTDQPRHNSGRGGSRGFSTDTRPRARFMGYKRLEELFNSDKEGEELANTLVSTTSGYKELLNSESIRPDLIRFILAVTSKACKSSARQTVIELLNVIVQSPFLERHIGVTYLAKIRYDIIVVRREIYLEAIGHILEIVQAIFLRLPNSYAKCESVLIIMDQLPQFDNLEEDHVLPLQNVLKELQQQAQVIRQRSIGGDSQREERNSRAGTRNLFETLPPPNDFRELSICPAYQDIHTDEKPYLRSNKDRGGYDDLDHYLDVQFRLLREDYVSPLRKGILEYLRNVQQGKQNSKLQDMRLYRDVQIICPRCTRDGIAYRIQFNTKGMGKIRWQSSKRLLYGSLLCLSSDNFQTMIFAIVIEREIKDLVDGFLDVCFVDRTFVPDEEDDGTRYVMAETTAYFEAYRHVLSGLQRVEALPFQRYIVACEHEVNPPRYLLHKAPPTYDLSSFLTNEATRQEKVLARSVPVLTTSRWPNRQTFCFDDSQLNAVKTALTKEFAIIQGPPGTGKTYVGLKIVQALLENKVHWSAKGPILVVCYTNHALDQFLEGMMEYIEDGLVRVGGRCENKSLQKFVIRNIKSRMKIDKEVRQDVRDGTRDCWREMMTIKEEIEQTSARLETCARGILYKNVLSDCMTEDQLDSFEFLSEDGFSGGRKVSAMATWLDLDTGMNDYVEDRFGQSDLFALRPENIDAVLLNARTNLRTTIHAENVQFLQTERQRFERELQSLQEGRYGSLSEGRQQSLWEMPLPHRWSLYSMWLHRLHAQTEFQVRATENELGILEQRFQNAVQQSMRNKRRKKKQPEDEEIRKLELKGAKLVQRLENLTKLQETMCNGILLTSRLLDVMTPTEKPHFQLQGQDQEYLVASWLNYGQAVQVISAHTDQGDDEDDDEDDFIDAEEDAEAIAAKRFVDDDDELDSLAKTKALDRKRMEALATEQLAVSLEREKRPVQTTENGWKTQGPSKGKLRKRIKQILLGTEEMPEETANNITDIWQLDLEERHQLYRHWIVIYRQKLKDNIRIKNRRYDEVAERLKEVKDDEDYGIMKAATVIGMTTTGAARLRHVLQRVQPRIIVVEEAAEVLEAHIISALNISCEHLILIGDHKQLRPSPAVYELAIHYKLELSLFERMVNNNVHCDTLRFQHRMRPEIAEVMRNIYPELQNHESVNNFEDVKGIGANIFFLDHTSLEVRHEENRSRSNEHEARFLSALCRYLILQGYERTKITVLTTYSGQVFMLKKQMPRSFFEGVRVTAVDNYQGEENDIILLSLVRSNTDGSIGFLNVDNRVCVALSRARKGLFVIGNFSLLASKSPLWTDIVTMLKSKGSFGPALELYCQNHPISERIKASSEKDFQKAPEGGCMRPCEARLDCGHQCEKVCHVLDAAHVDYQCQKPCGKTCEAAHRCAKRCYQPCGQCKVKVRKVIPTCQHEQMVPCHMDAHQFKCQDKCTEVLSCGHNCAAKCSEEHTRKCLTPVCRTWPCEHVVNTACTNKPENYPCPTPCGVVLDCEHPCPGKCGSCSQGKLHIPCKERCGRTLICGHECSQPCTKSCPPCNEKCENRCVHSVCNKTCGDPCVPCLEPCEWRCEHRKCSKLCGELCDRKSCDEPCKKTLPCGHPCIGLCAEVCPKLCRICDKEKVQEIFFGNEDEEDARFIILQDCGDMIETEGMDQWMSIPDVEKKTDVQLKACPKCKTTIWKSLRYGNAIKLMLRTINLVKDKIRGERKKFKAEKVRVLAKLVRTTALDESTYDTLHEKLISKVTTEAQIKLVENQISFLEKICKTGRYVRREGEREQLELDTQEKIQAELGMMTKCVLGMENYASDQRLREIRQEISRLSWLFRMHLYHHKLKESSAVSERAKSAVEASVKLLEKQTFTAEIEDKISRLDKVLKAQNVLLSVTEEERLMIVQAMGLSVGHWFKCPNGHVYAIGDCGGAVEEAKCPECPASIGGHSHNVRPDNRLAPEMDGARHAAWSDQANMENYDLDINDI